MALYGYNVYTTNYFLLLLLSCIVNYYYGMVLNAETTGHVNKMNTVKVLVLLDFFFI